MSLFILIACIVVFVFFFGYFAGKNDYKDTVMERTIKNEHKAKEVDNIPNADIIKLHDPYE